MKPTTDPDTGVTTCELSTSDRKTLATAKTILVKKAMATHGTRQAEAAITLASAIGSYLAADGMPNAPAEEQPEKSAK